jgi:hypothetical protein
MGAFDPIAASFMAPFERLGGTMYALADFAVHRIRERTASGRSISGQPFLPYTPEYARRKGVSEQDVTLVASGDMLSSLGAVRDNLGGAVGDPGLRGSRFRGAGGRAVAVRDVEIDLGVTETRGNTRAKAYTHHTGINRVWSKAYPRPWLGLSPSDESEMMTLFGREFASDVTGGAGGIDIVIRT